MWSKPATQKSKLTPARVVFEIWSSVCTGLPEECVMRMEPCQNKLLTSYTFMGMTQVSKYSYMWVSDTWGSALLSKREIERDWFLNARCTWLMQLLYYTVIISKRNTHKYVRGQKKQNNTERSAHSDTKTQHTSHRLQSDLITGCPFAAQTAHRPTAYDKKPFIPPKKRNWVCDCGNIHEQKKKFKTLNKANKKTAFCFYLCVVFMTEC